LIAWDRLDSRSRITDFAALENFRA
jgi:hypothetical protein